MSRTIVAKPIQTSRVTKVSIDHLRILDSQSSAHADDAKRARPRIMNFKCMK
ncbi:hypothetical protein Plhal703r1_c68g0170391 [Plasmopara halstedii]